MAFILSQIIRKKLPEWNEKIFGADDLDRLSQKMKVPIDDGGNGAVVVRLQIGSGADKEAVIEIRTFFDSNQKTIEEIINEALVKCRLVCESVSKAQEFHGG